MERILMAVCNNCVTGVCATVESSTHIVILSKDIYKLSFTLIAPLRPKDDCEL